jgi:biopolymer transport protein ExbD
VADIEKQNPVSVTVKGENELYVDDVQVSLADLSHRLASESTDQTQTTPGVLLFAEESVSYQTLFTVLDQITLAGIHDISLQAKLKN